MKRWLLGLLCFGLLHPVFAFDLEKKMFLSEHYFGYTTSFDVSSEERKLGTIYRRVLSLKTDYDFYDIKNKLISSAESHFFSFGAHLDIYDANKMILGTVEEKVFSWFPSFDLYFPDGTRLAHATMNFWGTKFTLYEGMGTHVLAEMSRDFFRLKNNWTLDIKDLDRVKARQIDARLLLTVLAVQCDIEYMESYRQQRERAGEERINQWLRPQARALAERNPTQAEQVENLHSKFSDFLKKEDALNQINLPNKPSLNALAVQLDKDFQQQYAGTMLNDTEASEQFVNYCINIAESADTTPETQKAILHLLQKRFTEQTNK